MNTYILNFAAILGFALASSSPGQSTFALNNHDFGVDAPVFDALGQPLAGQNYFVELWGGATADSLMPSLGAFSRQRVIISFGVNGYFRDADADRGGYATVFNVPPTLTSWLQVRAWDARLGATYEDALARGLGGYGESPLFQAVGSYPFAEPPSSPAFLVGLQSFSLRPIPEPSTWALLALGGVSWIVWRRRGRHSAAPPREG